MIIKPNELVDFLDLVPNHIKYVSVIVNLKSGKPITCSKIELVNDNLVRLNCVLGFEHKNSCSYTKSIIIHTCHIDSIVFVGLVFKNLIKS